MSARPRVVTRIDHVWIPMRDGNCLSARIWLPADAAEAPVPAVLEYIPYRKGDVTTVNDSRRFPYVAGFGYACARVDLRGSGDSEGILRDEYLQQELDDGCDVIAWLAAQPWCTGSVGMIGISWGGFNSLQIAAMQPPALRAVITVASTDDRFALDVHYKGGAVLGSGMLWWATTMLAYNARPPDPAVVGDAWRPMWLERLEALEPLVHRWLAHQRRDDYWRHGSICEDYAAIQCPVLTVGGWSDPYPNTVLRLLERLSAPRKGLIGPWGHTYGESGRPGPAIGFLQESIRWWDHWLKGEDTTIMDEPDLRAYMQSWVEPSAAYATRPGRWISEPVWPPTEQDRRTFYPHDGQLADEAPTVPATESICGLEHTGVDAGQWCPIGEAGDFPPDQRAEDGRSLTFTSSPLTAAMEILGKPELTLRLFANRPMALAAVRLCDVAPGGSSLLVTREIVNLTHRDGHDDPSALEPGRQYVVRVALTAVAHAFEPGHRVRISVSPTYWPWAWPSPERVTLSIETGSDTRLELPVRQVGRDSEIQFATAETSPALTVEPIAIEPGSYESRYDATTGLAELRWSWAGGGFRIPESGLEYTQSESNLCSIRDNEPLSAKAESVRRISLRRDDWQARIETQSTMTADADSFLVTTVLDAYEGDVRVFSRTWDASIARDLT